MFKTFGFWLFRFVSNFDIRISNFPSFNCSLLFPLTHTSIFTEILTTGAAIGSTTAFTCFNAHAA